MKKLVEKNKIDEDIRKDVYIPETLSKEKTEASSISFGFKKRDMKSAVKKRVAVVSDGETDWKTI